MTKLRFEDLIHMFHNAMTTQNVSGYINREYLTLKEQAHSHITNHNNEIRLAQLENDPSTRILAAQFDDTDLKDNRSEDGFYEIAAEDRTFRIKNGDYLALEQRHETNSSKIYIIQNLSFKTNYRKSNNS